MDDEIDKKTQAGRAFGYIVVFAMAVQATITIVWTLTGRPSVQLPTPILSLLFLIMLSAGMTVGVKAVAALKIEPLFMDAMGQDEENEGEDRGE